MIIENTKNLHTKKLECFLNCMLRTNIPSKMSLINHFIRWNNWFLKFTIIMKQSFDPMNGLHQHSYATIIGQVVPTWGFQKQYLDPSCAIFLVTNIYFNIHYNVPSDNVCLEAAPFLLKSAYLIYIESLQYPSSSHIWHHSIHRS